MLKIKHLLASVAVIVTACGTKAPAPKSVDSLKSPDGRLEAQFLLAEDGTPAYTLTFDGKDVIKPSRLGYKLVGGKELTSGFKLEGTEHDTIDETWEPVWGEENEIRNNASEMLVKLRREDGVAMNIRFRLYNDGLAYRFVSAGPVTVKAETAEFSFAKDYKAYIPYVSQHTETLQSQFMSSFESQYTVSAISKWDAKRLAFSPVTLDAGSVKLCVTEADLRNYPGLFLYNGNASCTLKGVFAPVPKEEVKGGHNMLQSIVTATEPYIAKDATEFPWRVVIVAKEDKELAQSDMVYRLAKPAEPVDWSWVKPGKVAWDWWNDWNIYGVDFASGINNDTYKYYIDFASAKGIEYVILDEGWSVTGQSDLMQVVPEIDIPMLSSYARSKGVNLILWAGYNAFKKDMDAVCAHYSKLGIKGWKIDFMDRNDQDIVRFYEQAAMAAAKYHMTVDFHGAYPPTGLNRTYPNIINYEGVYGLENMKWAAPEVDQVTYDVTIPFIRLVAGPADYTQGAMRNAAAGNYRPVNSEPMSQGTRCHQLAEYVVFDAPLTMLCDSPSNYLQEPECTDFIAGIPTVWDETIALDGKIGEYVVMARRKGSKWYVGALNGLQERNLTLDLSFIGPGEAVIFADGANAHRAGRDYTRTSTAVPAHITIHLAPGGGWVLETLF
jgi:alpha-glucosidase